MKLQDLLLAAQAKATPQYAKIMSMRGWFYTRSSDVPVELGVTKSYWTKQADITGNYRSRRYRIRLSCTT